MAKLLVELNVDVDSYRHEVTVTKERDGGYRVIITEYTAHGEQTEVRFIGLELDSLNDEEKERLFNAMQDNVGWNETEAK